MLATREEGPCAPVKLSSKLDPLHESRRHPSFLRRPQARLAAMCARDDDDDYGPLSARSSTRASSTTDLSHPAAQVPSFHRNDDTEAPHVWTTCTAYSGANL